MRRCANTSCPARAITVTSPPCRVATPCCWTATLSDNLLTWLYYDADLPRVEVIAEHNSEWGSLPGQTTHPHPLCSPDGRWISFNTTQNGRSDVAVVRV